MEADVSKNPEPNRNPNEQGASLPKRPANAGLERKIARLLKRASGMPDNEVRARIHRGIILSGPEALPILTRALSNSTDPGTIAAAAKSGALIVSHVYDAVIDTATHSALRYCAASASPASAVVSMVAAVVASP